MTRRCGGEDHESGCLADFDAALNEGLMLESARQALEQEIYDRVETVGRIGPQVAEASEAVDDAEYGAEAALIEEFLPSLEQIRADYDKKTANAAQIIESTRER
jgi:hypothetical protein